MTGGGPGFDLYGHLERRPDPSATCPLCGGVGGVVPHPELGSVCRLCGGPRISMPEGASLDDAAKVNLRKADVARKKRATFRALGVIGAVSLVFGVFVSLPILFFSFLGSLLTLLFISGPSLAIALFARARAQAQTKEIAEALDAAWSAAMGELIRVGKVKSAADAAKILGVDVNRAQELLTLASVDAEIGGALGLRVDTSGPTLAPDPRFAALEARAAAEAQAEDEANAALEAHEKATERTK